MSGVVAYYGGMVKNGLTIYLDASKRTSAQTFQNPIVGTKWRDLSGNANDVKFSGSVVYNQNFNSKVLYKRLGKTYLAHIEIDFFNRRIYIPKQPKEGKVYKGLLEALNKFQFNK
jgi:hypothetical protein